MCFIQLFFLNGYLTSDQLHRSLQDGRPVTSHTERCDHACHTYHESGSRTWDPWCVSRSGILPLTHAGFIFIPILSDLITLCMFQNKFQTTR